MSHLPDDRVLLGQYVRQGSEEAFRRLVERHVRMVYGVALRQVWRRAVAEDVTQAVFVVLARKAEMLLEVPSLRGWLLRATRYAGIDARREEARRKRHESAAGKERHAMNGSAARSELDRAAVGIDRAMGRLTAADRDAIVLRFYEDASYADMAAALGISEEAARKRTTPALGRLANLLRRRGVTSAAVLAGLLLIGRQARAMAADEAVRLAGRCAAAQGVRGSPAVLAERTMQMIQDAPRKVLIAIRVAGAGAAVLLVAVWVWSPKAAGPADVTPVAAAVPENGNDVIAIPLRGAGVVVDSAGNLPMNSDGAADTGLHLDPFALSPKRQAAPGGDSSQGFYVLTQGYGTPHPWLLPPSPSTSTPDQIESRGASPGTAVAMVGGGGR